MISTDTLQDPSKDSSPEKVGFPGVGGRERDQWFS